MSEYTPSTGEVREQYARGARGGYGGSAEAGAHRHVNEQNRFDRWLAAHDAEVRAEADKPAPCVMAHTPPFDFAQCETHDETFPLGGACKWHDKESVTEVLQDEVDEQRMRAVRAEHQLEILRAEQGETEYMVSDGDGNVWALTSDLDDARHYASQEPGAVIEARTCTPLTPVPDTTNNESEDEG